MAKVYPENHKDKPTELIAPTRMFKKHAMEIKLILVATEPQHLRKGERDG
jgi:hypothetical protein